MNEYEWGVLKRRVRNALATLTCNLPETDREIINEIEKIREMIR